MLSWLHVSREQHLLRPMRACDINFKVSFFVPCPPRVEPPSRHMVVRVASLLWLIAALRHLASLFAEDAPLPPVMCFAMGTLGFLTPFDAKQ